MRRLLPGDGWCTRVLLVLASIGLLQAQPASAKQRVTTSGVAQAIIVTRLSLVKTQDLDFGQLIAGTAAGTVTLAPDGVRSSTGGVRLAGSDGHPASFSGLGRQNQSVTLSVNSNTGTLRRVGGTETMRFDTFVIGSTPQAQLTIVPLAFRISAANGQFAFPVGATLRVGARQAPGIYSGTFTLTINYQ